MTNEEKAQEICEKNKQYHVACSSMECYLSALEMAKWKDQQYTDEKKELQGLVKMLPMDETNQTIIEDLKGLLGL